MDPFSNFDILKIRTALDVYHAHRYLQGLFCLVQKKNKGFKRQRGTTQKWAQSLCGAPFFAPSRTDLLLLLFSCKTGSRRRRSPYICIQVTPVTPVTPFIMKPLILLCLEFLASGVTSCYGSYEVTPVIPKNKKKLLTFSFIF